MGGEIEMTKQDAIEIIKMAIAQIEWEYPMDYVAAFDMAVEALSQQEIIRCKDCKHRLTSQCPCQCTGDPYYSWDPDDEWFCADGERAAK